MQNGMIVVTLRAEDFCRDFELPADEALSKLYPRLLEALQQASGRVFGGWKCLVLETSEGALLDGAATLHDYGICDGYSLNVSQEV